MIVSIHQPNHLPYLGFFDKVRRSDLFIVHDDCQFAFRDWQHRNKIRIYSGWKWLTVPVVKELRPINEIKIKNDRPGNREHWAKAHLRDIEANYAGAPFFESYGDELRRIYGGRYERLVELNMRLIRFLLKAFDIQTEMAFASEFGFSSKGTEKIIELVNAVGGDVYLSGAGGRNYLELGRIKDFKVVFQDFKHPVYPQRWPGFEPNMAAIDALFNVGGFPSLER